MRFPLLVPAIAAILLILIQPVALAQSVTTQLQPNLSNSTELLKISQGEGKLEEQNSILLKR
jgi:hypothetical protein